MPSSVLALLARLWPVAILIVAIASFQIGASLGKHLFPSIGASGITTMRMLMAAALLLVVLRPWRKTILPRTWPSLLGYGASLGMMNLLYYTSLQTVPQGIAVALEFTGPLAIALLNSRQRSDLCWVGLAIVGLATLLAMGQTEAKAIDPWGAACALGAGGCWAGYILFGQRVGQTQGTTGVALGMTVAALVVTPLGIAEAGMNLVSMDVLPLALGVAIMSAAIPYALEMYTLPRLTSQTFGTLMSLEPAAAAISALILLGQELASLQWLAIGLVVLASLGTSLTGQSAPEKSPVEAL